jgi:hypothetical protein
MNPDSGRLHATIESLREAEAVGQGRPPRESVEAALERAATKSEAESARSSVPQGAELPPNWPRFELGDRIGPIKGWWFRLEYVDLETQRLVIRPLEPARRGTKAPKRKRKNRRRRR